MLSIAIPIFNYPVFSLVDQLVKQCVAADIEFEICATEDGSTLFLNENERLKILTNVRYSAQAENMGRAAIRNLLADQAKFNNILFLDCDSGLENPSFISSYINNLDFDVVCGSRTYPKTVEPEFVLHKKFGENRESRSLKSRSENPYDHFMTNNFLISKSVFQTIRFDESLLGYGHEDTLFGWELEKKHATVKHIDNPIIHVGLDKNTEFISKSLSGIENGWDLYSAGKIPARKIRAVSVFEKLTKAGLQPIAKKYIQNREEYLTKNLSGPQPKLRNLDLLKLLRLFRLSGSDKIL